MTEVYFKNLFRNQIILEYELAEKTSLKIEGAYLNQCTWEKKFSLIACNNVKHLELYVFLLSS